MEPFATVVYLNGKAINAEDVKEASALIVRTRTKCNATLLKGSKVKFIASATIGYDHIDTQYCAQNGIKWTNAKGCNSGSVEQYVASALMDICKKEKKSPSKLTLGVVGVGNVGKKVSRLGRLLGFKVLINDPPRARQEGDGDFVSLNRIARKSDIITFHVPLNMDGMDKTFHLFDEKFLTKLEKKPYIINSSRGEVADTKALILGAKKNNVRGLILDVWENEPGIDKELMGLTDISTPHIAGYSADGKANGTTMSVEAVSKFFNFPIGKVELKDIPTPQDDLIRVNLGKHSLQSAVNKVLKSTYEILDDSEALRNEISGFEKLRNTYPVRREFGSYKVSLKNSTKEGVKLFAALGFQVIQ